LTYNLTSAIFRLAKSNLLSLNGGAIVNEPVPPVSEPETGDVSAWGWDWASGFLSAIWRGGADGNRADSSRGDRRFESPWNHDLRWNESKKLVVEKRDSRAAELAEYLYFGDDGELRPLVEKEESDADGWPLHE
jgi:hypothetical protein